MLESFGQRIGRASARKAAKRVINGTQAAALSQRRCRSRGAKELASELLGSRSSIDKGRCRDHMVHAGCRHSVVVIRGRPRPLRGISMSSEGT